jgi:hypothetical protein
MVESADCPGRKMGGGIVDWRIEFFCGFWEQGHTIDSFFSKQNIDDMCLSEQILRIGLWCSVCRVFRKVVVAVHLVIHIDVIVLSSMDILI